MSKVIAVIGAQWGDEGKGKIVDLLAERFDIVARYQGGHNAGHSVQVGDQSFVLHLLPSGIVHRGKTCVLGNGMVIDPKAFFVEADRLTQQGIEVSPERVKISSRAHLILPYHRALDHTLSLIHISEPTRLLSISYAVFCLKKKKKRIS